MITLYPLDRNNADQVADIRLRPDQLKFAGTVAEALAEPADRFDLHQINAKGRAVGLFKIDRAYSTDYPFATEKDLGLRAVILDQRVQGRGYGTTAMQALRAYLPRLYPQAETLFLTVDLANPAAIAVYRKAGFVDTGEIWPHGDAGPQHILSLPLRAQARC
ncbi:GNAT family N-acetyltransferase [Ruegeria sp. HKCCD7255]|uniref:GNAT family N-acetyltransferase n=1 Tax=Ruegeria sp. HKCCD7255 TaxID=2683004 RepID=UPI001487CF20